MESEWHVLVLFLGVFLVLSVATEGPSQTCPEPFIGLHEGCYYFHTELTAYNRSIDFCRELGGSLAQIDSAEEEQALTRYMEAQGMPQRKQIHNTKKKKRAVLTPKERDREMKYYQKTLCGLEKFGLVWSSFFNALPDIKVPMGKTDRALLTTPPGMSIRNSSNPNAGLGAWTDVFIPGKTILGYYGGKIVPAATVKDGSYAWIIKIQNEDYKVDAADARYSNWVRYVNSPRTDEEENVLSIRCESKMFYVVPRDIAPNTELMVSYGSGYDRKLGTERKHPARADSEILKGSWQIRINHIRVDQHAKLTKPDGSPVLYTNFRYPRLDYGDVRIKLLLSLYGGEWLWAKEEDYSFYTDLKDDYEKYPFICEKTERKTYLWSDWW